MTHPLHALPAGHRFACRQCGSDARPFVDHNGAHCHVTDAGLYCTYGPNGEYFGNHKIVRVPEGRENPCDYPRVSAAPVPVVQAEVLRTLDGDHDLLWVLPLSLQAGDVLLLGGACVRTVHSVEHRIDGRVITWVTAVPGADPLRWSLPMGEAIVVLRPVVCGECGDNTRHDPELCARWARTASVAPWQGAECPF